MTKTKKIALMAALHTVIIMAAIIMIVVISGCVATKTINDVAIPTLQMTHAGVHADANRGVDLLEADDQPPAAAFLSVFFDRVKRGDRIEIAALYPADWNRVKNLAEAGITHRISIGELTPTTAESKRERLRNWENLLAEMQRPVFGVH